MYMDIGFYIESLIYLYFPRLCKGFWTLYAWQKILADGDLNINSSYQPFGKSTVYQFGEQDW